MSSSGLLHQFFQKKRKRSRSPVATVSTPHPQVQDVDRNKRSPWTKRRAYYRRCRELALEDPSIGILQRSSQDTSAVASPARPQPTAHFVDPWTRTLPYWLLMLPLYIHVDSMAQTSYAQLLAYTRALEKERNGLYQDYIKVQDRYRRFVQHVKKRTAEWDREKSGKENKGAAPANTNSNVGMATVVEVPKPKSRRVTASPGRIRPEPMEVAPNQLQPPTAFHPPQHDPYHVSLPSYHDEANSSPPPVEDKIPSPIMSASLSRLSTSKQRSPANDKVAQVPLISIPRKHDPTNHQDDSQTVMPSQDPLASEGLGFQTTTSRTTSTTQSVKKQCHDFEESTRGSSHTTERGWISSRYAKEFVANNTSTEKVLPVVPPTNRPLKAVPHPPKGPITHTAKLNIQPANPQPPSVAPYCEVVRKKAERQALKPYACAECGKFIDAIMEEDKDGVYNRHELMCASRHRHRFTPPDTPPDFWELSFIDERDARLQQEQKEKALEN